MLANRADHRRVVQQEIDDVAARVQQGFEANDSARAVSELDGRDVKPTEHMVTETLIRGMFEYWRTVMQK